MLETAMLEQLKTVFERLDRPVVLRVSDSPHQQQADLLNLLKALASTSPLIQVELTQEKSPIPHFEIYENNVTSGVSFLGIPTGHEFTSLVLAILNSNKKGKMPDHGILERIKKIQGPIRIRTYMSLSCENCPEVVQSLNLIATVHPDFQHEVIDGEMVPHEIEQLKIQGVPAVFSGDILLHSGKSQLLALLQKLELHFGKNSTQAKIETKDQPLGKYDVLVIGGGPAGVSAAIYSARKGLKTALVTEQLGGQLRDTKGIENMISVPYTEGVKLAAQLSEHLSKYPVDIW